MNELSFSQHQMIAHSKPEMLPSSQGADCWRQTLPRHQYHAALRCAAAVHGSGYYRTTARPHWIGLVIPEYHVPWSRQLKRRSLESLSKWREN